MNTVPPGRRLSPSECRLPCSHPLLTGCILNPPQDTKYAHPAQTLPSPPLPLPQQLYRAHPAAVAMRGGEAGHDYCAGADCSAGSTRRQRAEEGMAAVGGGRLHLTRGRSSSVRRTAYKGDALAGRGGLIRRGARLLRGGRTLARGAECSVGGASAAGGRRKVTGEVVFCGNGGGWRMGGGTCAGREGASREGEPSCAGRLSCAGGEL